MERTVAVIKPGAVCRKSVGAIVDAIEHQGFEILDIQRLAMTPVQAADFYSEHAGRPYYDALIGHTLSGPCVALLLERDDAIQQWRQAIGPTDPQQGRRIHHLRAMYGWKSPDNALHGSDSTDAALREAAILGLRDRSVRGEPAPVDTTPAIRFERLYASAVLPRKSTRGAAGYDVSIAFSGDVPPGETRLFPTGWRIAVPDGYEAQLRSRSGLAHAGVVVANSPATIDADYRGPLLVLLHNNTPAVKSFAVGDRVAQLLLQPVQPARLVVVDKIEIDTARGEGGCGSTGK